MTKNISKGFSFSTGFLFVKKKKCVDKDLLNFTFTKDINHAIESTNISFICVPTPTTPEGIDLSYIKEATENIGKALANKEGYHLVVVKSTVVSGTTEDVVMPILEKYSGKKAGSEIGACMNPEFLTEISGTWSEVDEGTKKDFFTEDRIVIGEYDKKSGDIYIYIYRRGINIK